MGTIVIKNKGKESLEVQPIVEEVQLDKSQFNEEPIREQVITKKRAVRKKTAKAQVGVVRLTQDKMGKGSKRLYQTSNGSLREEFYVDPLYYFNASTGKHEAIDNTLVEGASERGLGKYYENRANRFNVKFAKEKNSKKHMLIEKDGCRVSLQLMGVDKHWVGDTVACILEGENKKDALGKAYATNQELVYEDILPDVDLKFLVRSNSVKDYLIIKKKKDD